MAVKRLEDVPAGKSKTISKELAHIDRQQGKRILKYLFERIATPEDPHRFGKALRFNLAGF